MNVNFLKLKTIPQREAAHPTDVTISKTALYSRLGTAEVEKPTGLLFQQPDLDSALQIARAEVLWRVRGSEKARPALGALGKAPGSAICK